MERHEAVRRRAISVAMKRKEEYLGARVPKELRDRVLKHAKEQGIPVSILIRNVLLEAFPEENANQTVRAASNVENTAQPEAKFQDVLGWEEIKLNRQVTCSGCSKLLGAGDKATLGVGAASPVLLCGTCSGTI